MKQVLLVFLGGGAGSVLRFLVTQNFNRFGSPPLGTFLVNIFGSLLIGIVLGLGLKNNMLSRDTSLFLATGFCGGFTTFSAFSYENQAFLKAGDFFNFGLYSVGSLLLGVLAVMTGLWISRLF